MSDSTACQHRIRVRYGETDRMGVAHHSAYVLWLEEARIEALGEMGFPYSRLEAEGVFMPVVKLEVDYRRSVTFDDVVDLETRCAVLGPSRLAMHTELRHGDVKIASGVVTLACVDGNARPQRLPADLVEVLVDN